MNDSHHHHHAATPSTSSTNTTTSSSARFRNSIDIYAAAFSSPHHRSRQRTSVITTASISHPHFVATGEGDVDHLTSPTIRSPMSPTSGKPSSSRMSFFSRFGSGGEKIEKEKGGGRGKQKIVAVKVEEGNGGGGFGHSRVNSLPNSPTPVGAVGVSNTIPPATNTYATNKHHHNASIKHRISSPILSSSSTPNFHTIPIAKPAMPPPPILPPGGFNNHNDYNSGNIVAPIGANHTAILEQYPLCVARLQSLRSTLLPASTTPTEKLLRRTNPPPGGPTSKKDRRSSRVLQRHTPSRSADLDKSNWTKCLYVLMPGMLLRFGGDGGEDRIPEKALRLGPGAKAFASDVLEGRKWVLQIVRDDVDTFPAIGTATVYGGKENSSRRQSFLGKVTGKGKPANVAVEEGGIGRLSGRDVMFMVFEKAEEMETWMSLIRGEAARLGGRPATSGTISGATIGGGRTSFSHDPLMEEDEYPPYAPLTRPPGFPNFEFASVSNDAPSSSTLPSTSEEGTASTTEPPRADPRASTYTRASATSSKPSSSHTYSSSIPTTSLSPQPPNNRTSIISADRASLEALRFSARPTQRFPLTTVTTVSPETSPERESEDSRRRSSRTANQRFSRSSVELRNHPPLEASEEDPSTDGLSAPLEPPGAWLDLDNSGTSRPGTPITFGPPSSSEDSDSAPPPPLSSQKKPRPSSLLPPSAPFAMAASEHTRRRSMGAISRSSSPSPSPSKPDFLSPFPPPNRRSYTGPPLPSSNRRSFSGLPPPSPRSSLSHTTFPPPEIPLPPLPTGAKDLELAGPKGPPPSIPLPQLPPPGSEARPRQGRRSVSSTHSGGGGGMAVNGEARERRRQRRASGASTTSGPPPSWKSVGNGWGGRAAGRGSVGGGSIDEEGERRRSGMAGSVDEVPVLTGMARRDGRLDVDAKRMEEVRRSREFGLPDLGIGAIWI